MEDKLNLIVLMVLEYNYRIKNKVIGYDSFI